MLIFLINFKKYLFFLLVKWPNSSILIVCILRYTQSDDDGGIFVKPTCVEIEKKTIVILLQALVLDTRPWRGI